DVFFTDAWLAAPDRLGEGVGTFNDFIAAEPNGPRIDWILLHGPVTIVRTEISTFSRNGQFPSDHFPVTAWIRMTPAKDALNPP
ncbi:MAG: hypothetical protein MUC91_03895, partial [Verrucomicrobia bacterium]|nr:hypothetical protein [Verrucomicrobiota bacterium]